MLLNEVTKIVTRYEIFKNCVTAGQVMFTKKQLLTKGLLSVAPHMFSVIPFGIVCGAIGIELGFSPILVYAMSIIIFGGASQIVFLQLLSGGASTLIAVTSVGVINSRHLLYGAVLSEYLEKLSFVKKLLISYLSLIHI